MVSDRSSRVGSLDVAKALVITGIIFNHVVAGLRRGGMIDHSHALVGLNNHLYLWRMPTLAFALGLFIPMGVAKLGAMPYLRRRAWLMLWPLVIWFVVLGIFTGLTAGVSNGSGGWASLARPWVIDTHLWFLPFVIVSTAVVSLLKPWVSRRRAVVAGVLTVAASLVTWTFNPTVLGGRGLALIAFVCAGAVVGLPRLRALVQRRRAVLVLGVAALVITPLLWLVEPLPPTVLNTGLLGGSDGVGVLQIAASMLSGVTGIVLLVCVGVLIERLRFVGPTLTRLGQLTLGIFVVHTIFTAGARVLLTGLGVTHIGLHVAAGMAAGLVGGVLVVLLAERWMPWLFVPPTTPKSSASTALRGRLGSGRRGTPDTALAVVAPGVRPTVKD